MDAEVFFYALACPRMALANTFLCGQRLAKKAFDCGVEDWVLCAIQGKREGWAARERWRVLQEQTSAAEWGLLGQATRAGQGAPGPLHDSSLHQQAGLIGWGSQQDISHSGLIWDQQGPCKAVRPIYCLYFQFLGHNNWVEVDRWCTCHVSKRMSEPVHAMMQPYVRVYFLAAMLWHHLVVTTTLIPG